MLVPVVWFEESALIPEESAKMFRSIYTDKIRLIRTVIGSLFFIALCVSIASIMASQYFTNCYNSFKIKSSTSSKTSTETIISSSKTGETNTGGSSLTSSSNKSGQSILTANDDSSCLIRQKVAFGRGGSKLTTHNGLDNNNKVLINNQYINNAELPLLAKNNEQSSVMETQAFGLKQQEGNLQRYQKFSLNNSANLDQNKSVEFAVHYNDTLLLVEGQQVGLKQQQQQAPKRSNT